MNVTCLDTSDAKKVYPDIIVHKRNSNQNLVVIEAKKSSSDVKEDWDKAKLRAFKESPYHYLAAFFILFRVRDKEEKGIVLEEL